jgi:hypothetical protein
MPFMDGSTRDHSGPATWVLRVLLAALMVLAAVNIFTGVPLLSLWVGAKIEGNGDLTMGIVFAVIAMLALGVGFLGWALSRLGRAYDSVTGHEPPPRQRAPWLRSMRDEPEHKRTRAGHLTGLEKTLVASVVIAVLAFEVWFFFFAGSSLPNTT